MQHLLYQLLCLGWGLLGIARALKFGWLSQQKECLQNAAVQGEM